MYGIFNYIDFINLSHTLPETNIALENPPFSWYLPVNLGMFYGYVSLTEGIGKYFGAIRRMWDYRVSNLLVT